MLKYSRGEKNKMDSRIDRIDRCIIIQQNKNSKMLMQNLGSEYMGLNCKILSIIMYV